MMIIRSISSSKGPILGIPGIFLKQVWETLSFGGGENDHIWGLWEKHAVYPE